MNNRFVCAFIFIACTGYAILAWKLPPNSDERASIVIVLGHHPSMVSVDGTPISTHDYFEALNYKKYRYSGVHFSEIIQSVINDNSNSLIYYLLLSGCIKIFGLSVFCMRLLTILLAGVNLGLLYVLSGVLQKKAPSEFY